MTDFLSGLTINLADRFRLAKRGWADFDVVQNLGEKAKARRPQSSSASVRAHGELQAPICERFGCVAIEAASTTASVRAYLVIDRSAPVLDVMAKAKKAPPADARSCSMARPADRWLSRIRSPQ